MSGRIPQLTCKLNVFGLENDLDCCVAKTVGKWVIDILLSCGYVDGWGDRYFEAEQICGSLIIEIIGKMLELPFRQRNYPLWLP